MKLRWWIIGTVAVVAGGVFIVKHFLQGENFFHFLVHEKENSSGKFLSENQESEFDGTDLIV